MDSTTPCLADVGLIPNWFQYFTPESLEAELSSAGFSVDKMCGDLTGEPLKVDGDFIGVVANVT